MLYRLRWTIELDNKLAKTGCQLDEITAERPVSAEILVHASMIASMLANAIVHQDQISQGAVAAKTVRPKRGPLHAMLVWKIVVVGASRTADELRTPGSDPKRWVNLASHLTHSAADPNWRRKPSPMDLVKGRTTTGRAWRGGPKAASARRAAA